MYIMCVINLVRKNFRRNIGFNSARCGEGEGGGGGRGIADTLVNDLRPPPTPHSPSPMPPTYCLCDCIVSDRMSIVSVYCFCLMSITLYIQISL